MILESELRADYAQLAAAVGIDLNPASIIAAALVSAIAAGVIHIGRRVGKWGRQMLAALVELGKLPDAVDHLTNELGETRGQVADLGRRVTRLEGTAGTLQTRAGEVAGALEHTAGAIDRREGNGS